MSSIFKIIGSYKRKLCFMLLRFFKNVNRGVSKSSKAVYFLRIRHGCGIIFGKSKEYKSCSYGDDDDDDDKYDYALATYLEIGIGDYDGHYDYAPTTSLEGDDNDVGRDYDYAPAAGDVII
ncbi:hypothetical protein MTR67_053336 [Solanum verrucosum]|uniref:Uncharacterized protein n=1 Tax=Solanum verrucosum TaxID=315347 RepID=A0AAF0VAQ1_SOLVR|nr:hypothetical protein MTR67_053336 [Solanum verrucosum]